MEYEKIKQAADFVASKIDSLPKIAIILGSGLGEAAEKIQNKIEIPYGEIPHFAVSTVQGHKGQFVCGTLNGAAVICMQGRLHYYEGHSMQDIVFPVRVMKCLGVETLVVTNAAGGVNLGFNVGDIMLIEDHINFMGKSPLIGQNVDELGPRFCDMTHVYTPSLKTIAKQSAQQLSIDLKTGIYLALTGPNFETPAEIRAFRTLGADAVGMSTVPEVIAASHCGLDVLGFSLITNKAAGVTGEALTHEEVMEIGKQRGAVLQSLVFDIVGKIANL